MSGFFAVFMGGNQGAVSGIPVPSYAFPLTGPTLPTGATLTRSSTGTYVANNGVVTTAGTNSPRFEFAYNSTANDWSTRLGLMIEPSSTNVFRPSDDITTAGWIKLGVDVTGTKINAADNTTTAVPIKATGTTGDRVQAQINVTSGGTTGFSGFFKYVSGDVTGVLELSDSANGNGGIWFNLQNGTITATQQNHWTVSNQKVTKLANNWFRVEGKAVPDFTSSGSNTQFDFFQSSTISPPTGTTTTTAKKLPDRIMGIYSNFEAGGTPTLDTIRTEAPQFNVFYAGFAACSGAGFNIEVGPHASVTDLKNQVTTWKNSGRIALLTIGSGTQAQLTTQSDEDTAYNSLVSIIDQVGYNGIDWDYEGGTFTAQRLVNVSRRLKNHYGPNFVVSMVPRPFEARDANDPYRQALALDNSAFDLCGIQFYDGAFGSVSTHDSFDVNDVASVVSGGTPPNKIVFGCEAPGGGTGWISSTDYLMEYNKTNASQGGQLRGMFVWDSATCRSSNWDLPKTFNSTINPDLASPGTTTPQPTTTLNSTFSGWGLQFEGSAPTSYMPTTVSATTTRAADLCTLTIANGTYDILVEDTNGSEWRNGVVITTGSYTLLPRPGQTHVTNVRVWPHSGIGSLTQAQKDSIGSSALVNPPIAVGETYSATKNTPLTIAAPGVLANDTDPQGLSLIVKSYDNLTTGGGSVVVNSNGSFTYTPTATFVGDDTFTYDIQNSSGVASTSRATVHISVSGTSAALSRYYFIGEQPDSTSAKLTTVLGFNIDTLTDQGGVGGADGARWSKAQAGKVLNYGLFTVQNGTSFTDNVAAANGSYNAQYDHAAQTVNGVANAICSIRIDTEGNGYWFPWGFGSGGPNTAQNFAAAFRNLANSMRTYCPTIPIEYNMGGTAANPNTAWPGDQWVDIVSIDWYDNGSVYATGADLWNFWQGTSADGSQGALFKWLDAFTLDGYTGVGLINGPRRGNKLIAFPEWGIGQSSGDAVGAAAIPLFADWIHARTNRVAYHAYWNSDLDFVGDLNHYPSSKAAYASAFGRPTYIGTWTPVPSGTITGSDD